MSGVFYVAHNTAGRTRIRWAGDAAGRTGVGEIATDIADIAGVDQATPRAATGSIIIEHEQTDWHTLEPRLTDALSLTFVYLPRAEPPTAMDTINRGLGHVNGALKGINTDLGSMSVFMLLLLAVTQAYRGQVMGSAVSFLWYALNIAKQARGTVAPPADNTEDAGE